jgi:IS5 family transposase
MDRIVPWAELCAVIEPHYPKRGNGPPPSRLENMLHIHFIQHWFNLAVIDLGCEAVPDATTLLKFHRLLEKHSLCVKGIRSFAQPFGAQKDLSMVCDQGKKILAHH